MIELYLAILLLGLGSYINNQGKKTTDKKSSNKSRKNSGNNNSYLDNQSVADKIKELEKKHTEEISQRCEKVVPRSFTELLDSETRELYDKSRDDETGLSVDRITDENKDNRIRSKLTGMPMTQKDFMTNSRGDVMLPFFGGKLTQNMNSDVSQRRLDTFTGTGNYRNKKKKESKPLFKPTKNLGFVYGSPNKTNEFLERYNKSNYANNVLPFKQLRVAPGLNEKGGRKGAGGFHQFEVNEIARSSYKNIDDLNVRQQITYTTPTKTGGAINQKRSLNPNISKNRPETTFAQSMANQWKTPAGASGMSAREHFVAYDKGKKQSKALLGSAAPAINVKPRKISIAQKSKRNTYTNSGLRNVKIVDGWTSKGLYADYGRKGFKAPPTERESLSEKTHITNWTSIVKALISPFEDVARITKKQNIVGNPRPTGNMKANVPNKQTVYDPNDIAKTTLKEQLIHNSHEGHIKGPNKLIAYDPNDVARTTLKEQMIDNKHSGNITITKTEKPTVYDYDTAPKITIRNTLESVDYNANVSSARSPSNPENRNQDDAKATIKEQTEDNVYSSNVKYAKGMGYITEDHFVPATNKQELSDYEYSGIAGAREKGQRSYASSYNASLNVNKEQIARGRKPMGSNVKIVNGKDTLNTMYKKQMSAVNTSRKEVTNVYSKPPTNEGKVYTNLRVNLSNEHNVERIKPDLLDAFNENPFTQPLNSYGVIEA